MNKLLLLLTCLVMFTGCKKENDENGLYPLNGTTWESKITYSPTYSEINTILFHETTCDITVVEIENGEIISNGGTGTYTYKHPTVTMTSNGETIVGTISGNTMTAGDYTLKKK